MEQETRDCIPSQSYLIQHMEGYISPEQTESRLEPCPWLLRAQPGQTIKITLIDFQPQPNPQQCVALGYIKDASNDQEKMICKSSKREQHLYESAGPSLQIHVGTGKTNHRFLLHYKGISYL